MYNNLFINNRVDPPDKTATPIQSASHNKQNQPIKSKIEVAFFFITTVGCLSSRRAI